MKLIEYKDITTFMNETWQILLRHEVQNNLLMGNAKREAEGGKSNDLKIAVKDDKGHIKLIGIMTLPFNLVLYEVNNEACEEALLYLASELINRQVDIPGVIGEKGLVRRFSEIYTAKTHTKTRLKLSMNLMMLTELIEPSKASGSVRKATREDLYFLPYWQQSFAKEAQVHVPTIEESEAQLSKAIEKVYIWEDTYPVSTAAASRSLEHGVGIAFVYTPPMFRGKGYASSCVAELTKQLLKTYQYCYLFADQANPISNGIYERLGYKTQCLFEQVMFVGENAND